jgi:NADH-quinone oxidoreductase subunit J
VDVTAVQILFIIIAAATLGAALMVVTTRNLIHAALWLVVALFGVAVFFVLLDAGFLAVAQVVIYIGAIAILMIFAIMLTRRVVMDIGPPVNANWPWAAGLGVILFVALVWMLNNWSGMATSLPEMSQRADPLQELGAALVSPAQYVLPFELASVLLLSGLIGAIIVAWDRK